MPSGSQRWLAGSSPGLGPSSRARMLVSRSGHRLGTRKPATSWRQAGKCELVDLQGVRLGATRRLLGDRYSLNLALLGLRSNQVGGPCDGSAILTSSGSPSYVNGSVQRSIHMEIDEFEFLVVIVER